MIFSNLILLILVLLFTSEIKNNTRLKIVIKQAITEAINIITYLFIYIKNNNSNTFIYQFLFNYLITKHVLFNVTYFSFQQCSEY